MSKLRVGERVSIIKGSLAGNVGRIAFEGKVQFAPGLWVGVVLEKPVGKNDGTVQGVRYFQCRQRFGTFQKVDAVEKRKPKSSSRGIKSPSVRRTQGGPSPRLKKPTSTSKTAASKTRRTTSGSSTPSSPLSTRSVASPARIPQASTSRANSRKSVGARSTLRQNTTSNKKIREEQDRKIEGLESKLKATLSELERAKLDLKEARGSGQSDQEPSKELRDAKQRINALEGELKEAHASGAHLERENQSKAGEIARLEAKMKTMQEARRRSAGPVDEDQSQPSFPDNPLALSPDVKKLREALQSANKEKEAALAKASRLEAELDAAMKKGGGAIRDAGEDDSSRVSELEAQLAEKTKELAEAREDANEALDRLEEVETELTQAKEAAETRGEEGKGGGDSVGPDAERQLLELKQKLRDRDEALVAEKKKADEKLEAKETVLKARDATISTLEKKISSIEAEAKASDNADVEMLKFEHEKRVQEQKKEFDSVLKRMRSDLIDKRRQAEQERDEKKRRLEHVTGNLEKINSMYNEEQSKRAELEEKLKSASAEATKVKELLELEKLEKEEIELTLEEKEEELVDVFQQLQKASKANSELKAQLTSVKGDLISAMPEGEREKAELAEKNKQLTDALVSLRDATTDTISRLEKEVKDLSEERDMLQQNQQSSEELEAELQEATEQVAELQAELEEYGDMDATVEKLQDKITTLEEKLEKSQETNEGLKELVQANEEMEESHVEIENELQEEIAEKEAALTAAEKRIRVLIAKQKDHQHTIARFRELTADLQEENKGLKSHVGAISTKSKMQIEKVHNAISRNLKLQSVVSEARVKTAAYHIANMKANQAEQFAKFVQCYIPESIEVNQKVFSVLSVLERLRFTATLIGAMLNQYHGLKAPIFDADMANLAYRGCAVTVDISHAVLTINHKLEASDELGVQAIASRSSTIRAVEKPLIAFLNLVTHDKLSVETSLEPLQNAVQDLRAYHHKYLQDVEAKLGERHLLQILRLDALRVHYNHLLSVAKAKQVSELLDVVKVNGIAEENEAKEAKETEAVDAKKNLERVSQLEDAFESLRALAATSTNILHSLKAMDSVPEGLEDGKFPQKKISNASQEALEIITKIHMKLENMLGENFDPSTKSSQMQQEVGNLVEENLDTLTETIKTIYEEFNVVAKVFKSEDNESSKGSLVACYKFVSELDTKVQDGEKVSWMKQAESVKTELAETSEKQKELKTARETLEENKTTIFHLRKEVQAKVTKNSVLSTQIALLQDRAGNAESLQVQIQTLETQLGEKEAALARRKTENDSLTAKMSHLRRRYEEERALRKRYPQNQVVSQGSLAPEEAQAEIQLLRSTIEHLQLEYNSFRWRDTTARLQRELPPLPKFKRDDSLSGSDPSSLTNVLARELKALSTQVMSQRSSPKLVNLSVNGASQRWLSHIMSLRKLGRQARDIQRRLSQVVESQSNMKWVNQSQPVPNPRLVGRITLPTLPSFSTISGPKKVVLNGSQMAELCRPLMAW